MLACDHPPGSHAWLALPLVGTQDDGDGCLLEVRRCPVCTDTKSFPRKSASIASVGATTMMKPTVHLNGTARESLAVLFHTALLACETAIDALHVAMPHGRDYYPQGDSAFKEATAEHLDRIARVGSVYVELEELMESVSR